MTKCEECTLNSYGYVPIQEPTSPQFSVLFYGQAGGSTEDITGVPFTGKAGKMFWRLLKEAALNKSHLYISNIVGCVPPEDRRPTDHEVACCHARVYDEIQRIQPELIVALGDVASKALTGNKHITSIRGQKFPLLSEWDYTCSVLCTLHPSFVMRQRQWIEIVVDDLKQVVSFFMDEPVIEVINDQPTFLKDPPASKFAEELEIGSSHQTSFDIETPGELNPRKAEIIGISFCYCDNKAMAIDLFKGDPRWEIMQRFLEDNRAYKIAQNGQFDTACLDTNGVTVKGWKFDTRLASHTLNSDLPSNLDFLRSRYTKIPPYKPSKKDMKTIAHWDADRRLTYGCLDALTTWVVAQEEMALMDERHWKVLNEIEMPLVPVINKMEKKGVLVDISALALLHSRLLPDIEAMKEKYFDPLGLNPNSPIQMGKYFGIEDTEEDTLEKHIKRGHEYSELMRQLLEYRGIQKTDSVYIIGVYNRLEEGKIHTHYKPEGTGTGRLASEDPNLQNVPKWLRVIYISDDGKVWVEGDYSQLELRVLGIISGEQLILEELGRGQNTHHIIAYEIFHKKWDKLTEEQKLRAKAVVFGTAYGRSARSIAIEFNIPTSVAEDWQSLCINRYPGFLSYKQHQIEEYSTTGQCQSPFGRVRTLQGITQAFNTPVQSSGSDVCILSLIELDKAGIDLRLTVHDSIATQFDEKEVLEGAREMKKIMERPIPQLNNYKFPIKSGIGKDWCNLKEVKI